MRWLGIPGPWYHLLFGSHDDVFHAAIKMFTDELAENGALVFLANEAIVWV